MRPKPDAYYVGTLAPDGETLWVCSPPFAGAREASDYRVILTGSEDLKYHLPLTTHRLPRVVDTLPAWEFLRWVCDPRGPGWMSGENHVDDADARRRLLAQADQLEALDERACRLSRPATGRGVEMTAEMIPAELTKLPGGHREVCQCSHRGGWCGAPARWICWRGATTRYGHFVRRGIPICAPCAAEYRARRRAEETG